MSMQRHAALLPLCLGLLVGTTATLASAKTLPAPPSGPTATLTTSSSAGSASVVVDGAGAFSEAYVFTDIDSDSSDLSFRSGLYIDGVEIPVESVKQPRADKASSTYALGSLQVRLVQELAPAVLVGAYVLSQSYTLDNPGPDAVTLNLVRYNDSDMFNPDTGIQDLGYQPRKGRYSYIVSDTAPTPATLTKFIGIQLSSGNATTHRAVRQCCNNVDDILPEENNTVPNDLDLNGISDMAGDMAMANQAAVTVPAGGTVKVKVQTLFGRSALDGLAALPAR